MAFSMETAGKLLNLLKGNPVTPFVVPSSFQPKPNVRVRGGSGQWPNMLSFPSPCPRRAPAGSGRAWVRAGCTASQPSGPRGPRGLGPSPFCKWVLTRDGVYTHEGGPQKGGMGVASARLHLNSSMIETKGKPNALSGSSLCFQEYNRTSIVNGRGISALSENMQGKTHQTKRLAVPPLPVWKSSVSDQNSIQAERSLYCFGKRTSLEKPQISIQQG